jgi:hypothetical protein
MRLDLENGNNLHQVLRFKTVKPTRNPWCMETDLNWFDCEHGLRAVKSSVRDKDNEHGIFLEIKGKKR